MDPYRSTVPEYNFEQIVPHAMPFIHGQFYNPRMQNQHGHYHYPLVPTESVPIFCVIDPENRPQPIRPSLVSIPSHYFTTLGVRLHNLDYVNLHREKVFTRYGFWFLEINDDLFRHICPSDLNNMPCEWDELQGGCPMLRLCEVKSKYPHPRLGNVPRCSPESRHNCTHVHDIDPTCRSIALQLCQLSERQFRGQQLCKAVASNRFCWFGHDWESARANAVYQYRKHRREARRRGSIGCVKQNVLGQKLVGPIYPIERRA